VRLVNNLLSKLDPGDVLILLLTMVPLVGGLLLSLVLGLAGILTSHRRRARQLELEMALKQEMVRKGLTAEDIERVIRASSTEETPSPARTAAVPVAQEMTSRQLDILLATKLAEMGMDAKRLEQALGAVAGLDLGSKQAVVPAVVNLIDQGTDEEQVHAAIMGLCKSPGPGTGSTHHPGLATFAPKG
jgi:hypothetical protein